MSEKVKDTVKDWHPFPRGVSRCCCLFSLSCDGRVTRRVWDSAHSEESPLSMRWSRCPPQGSHGRDVE